MKLSYLFVVSAAAVVPAGALGADPQVDLRTNLGTIRLELYPAAAPKTVENFLQYVKDGQYNGTIFHRVIDGFMIQGGGFDKSFKEKNTRAPIVNEASSGVKAGLMNKMGTIAMARTSDPNSATAQFFINVRDNDFLNWGNPRGDGNGYAVFGKVVSGLEVVSQIAKLPTGPGGPMPGDVPKQQVIIESATVVGAK
jgi:peptidyl-prolyl cis-trans isomerase B (cyclophilin B)